MVTHIYVHMQNNQTKDYWKETNAGYSLGENNSKTKYYTHKMLVSLHIMVHLKRLWYKTAGV